MAPVTDDAAAIADRPTRAQIQRTYALLALIVSVGLALRIYGLAWSLPDARHPITTYHPDELINLQAAQRVDISHGKFDTGFYNYGTFYFYLASLADTVGHGYHLIPTTTITDTTPRSDVEILRLQVRERAGEFLAARLITALLGTSTLPVLFLLGRRLYGSAAGLLAALLYAAAPLAVVHAHFVTVDVPATFFVTVALLSASSLLASPGLKSAAWAGFWCALAAATKYTAGLCIIAPTAAIILAGARRTGHFRSALTRELALQTAVLVGVSVLVFLVACPGPWINGAAFFSSVRYELFEHARTGHGYLFVDTGPGWWYHLTVSLRYGLGLPLLLLSAAGVVFAARRREPADTLLLVFLAIGYAATSFSAVRFARYLIPFYPALCLLAGRVAAAPYAQNAVRRMAIGAGLVVVAAGLVVSGGLVRAMAMTDPRDRSADYLTSVSPPRATIAFAHIPWYYSPPLSPLWGALRSDVRARALPDPPVFEFRMPASDWDRSVLTPPPDYVVVSNIELATEWKHLHMPAAVGFMEAVQSESERVVFKPGLVPGLSPDDPDVPQDVLYVLPEIMVYTPRHTMINAAPAR